MKSDLMWCNILLFFFLFFSPQAFVENNPAIKWCPIPGCERAVRLTRQGSNSTGSDTLSFPMLKAPAVDCGKGHLFCWLVLETRNCIYINSQSLLFQGLMKTSHMAPRVWQECYMNILSSLHALNDVMCTNTVTFWGTTKVQKRHGVL